MSPRRALAPALAALLATLGARSALSVERLCAAPSVEADAGFVARFPDLLASIRADLARPDVDACAHVELSTGATATIRVSVKLPDGRATSREAERPEDILPTLQALLLIPEAPPTFEANTAPPAPAATAATMPHQSPRGAAPVLPLRNASPTHDRTTPPRLEPRSLGFELSLVGGPRMGEDQLALGLGALSFLEVHGYLFGFHSRIDRYQRVLGSDPEMALELAALAGKRWHFRSFALDIGLGPAVAMKGLAFSSTEVVRVGASPELPPAPPDDPSTGPVPRLLFGARAGFTPRDVLRSFAGVEASLGPARADESANQSSSRFPVVALGLVLGATVGTR